MQILRPSTTAIKRHVWPIGLLTPGLNLDLAVKLLPTPTVTGKLYRARPGKCVPGGINALVRWQYCNISCSKAFTTHAARVKAGTCGAPPLWIVLWRSDVACQSAAFISTYCIAECTSMCHCAWSWKDSGSQQSECGDVAGGEEAVTARSPPSSCSNTNTHSLVHGGGVGPLWITQFPHFLFS